jgi:hypothetical protein
MIPSIVGGILQSHGREHKSILFSWFSCSIFRLLLCYASSHYFFLFIRSVFAPPLPKLAAGGGRLLCRLVTLAMLPMEMADKANSAPPWH